MSRTILQLTQKVLGKLSYCSFFSPKRARVLVVDSNRDHDMSAVLGDVDHTFVEVRGEKIYLSPGVLWALFEINFCEARKRRVGSLRALLYALSSGHGRYVDACVRYVRPKVVITLVDNNVNFFNRSSRFPNIAFVAIQAAWRVRRNIVPLEKGNRNHAYYFCLSEHDRDMFRNFGYDKNRIIVSGSLRQSLWAKSPNPLPRNFDLCITSQWRAAFINGHPLYPTFGKVITAAYHGMAKLIEETGLSCCIATSTSDCDEVAYYREIFGPDVHINERNSGFATYDIMAASSLVLTVNSTSGREAAAMGIRVIFWDPPSEESVYEDQTTASSLFVTEAYYDKFRDRVREVLSMNDDEYDQKYGAAANHLMARQEAISTADQIKEFVQQKLNS